MNNIKISVIVPVYNAEKYIGRALDSVLGQTYSNWEIILVNDGSTDNSENICRLYLKDERVNIISQKNQGVCVARNRGIQNATGDVIVFLDADDYFCADAFGVIASQWSTDTEFIVFGYNEIHENKKVLAKSIMDLVDSDKKIMKNNVQLLMCRTDDWGAPWGKVFSRKILQDNQIAFVDGIFLNEDRLFNLQYLKQIDTVKYIDKKIYNYYLSNDSVTSKVFDVEDSRIVENSAKCCKYLSEIYNEASEQEVVIKFKFMCVKMVLWWASAVSDIECRKLGEQFCNQYGREIFYSGVHLDSMVDKVILNLCRKKRYALLRMPIAVRRKMKAMLGKR